MGIISEIDEAVSAEWRKHPDLMHSIAKLSDLRDMLSDVIEAAAEMPRWKVEAEYWRRKHGEHLNDSIRHGERMTAMMIGGLIGGVEGAAEICAAFDKANPSTPSKEP